MHHLKVSAAVFLWRTSVLFPESLEESDLVRETGSEDNFFYCLPGCLQQIPRDMQPAVPDQFGKAVRARVLNPSVKTSGTDGQGICDKTRRQIPVGNIVIYDFQDFLKELSGFLVSKFPFRLFV